MFRLAQILVAPLLAALVAAGAPVAVVAQQETQKQSAEGDTEAYVAPSLEEAERRDRQSRFDAEYFMSDDHRVEIYEKTRLRHSTAVLYSLVLPGLGNIYAEQYFIAGIEIIFFTFTVIFLVYGLSTQQPQFYWIGGILGATTYGSAVGTSLYGVTEYNRLLRRGLKIGDGTISFAPAVRAPDRNRPAPRPGVTFTLRF